MNETRKPATVTDQSLIDAFQSDTQGSHDPTASDGLRVYLLLGGFSLKERQWQVIEKPFAELEVCLQLMRVHLQGGNGYGAMLEIATSPPKAFLRAQKALSASV